MSPPPTHAPSGPSTNPFDDDDDSDYDDETISRMLDNMDIDADFNCWTSFRASMSIKSKSSLSSAPGTIPHGASSGGTVDTIGEQGEEESLTRSEQEYIDKWSRRVDREEVYSTTYRPVPREEREIKDLAAFLGVSGGAGGGGSTAKQAGGAGGFLDKINKGNLVSLLMLHLVGELLVSPGSFANARFVSTSTLQCNMQSNQKHEKANHNTTERSAVLKLLFPLPNEEKSVLLKRGPALMRKRGQVDYEERELILLSRGLIIATPLSADEVTNAAAAAEESSQRKMPSALTKIPSGLVNGLARIPSGRGRKVIHRHFESAMLLSSIRLEDMVSESNSFAIFVDEGTSSVSPVPRLVFTCAKLPQKEAWMTAIGKVLHYTEINRDNAVDGARKAAGVDNSRGEMAANAMSRNMAALQERGDRLEKLDDRTADLERNAADYRETARQLKEKAKKQNVFGL